MDHNCTKDGKTIRCECGGQLAVGGVLHPISYFGLGVSERGGLMVHKSYSRKVIGYTGFCLKCRKEGRFLLPGQKGVTSGKTDD